MRFVPVFRGFSAFWMFCWISLIGGAAVAGGNPSTIGRGCEIGWEKPLEAPTYPAKLRPAVAGSISESSGLREPDMDWVNATLAGMTLDEKIGQMMMPWYDSGGSAGQIATYRVSGFVFSSWNTSGVASVVQAVNSLQSQSAIPLWFSVDSETGVGARYGDEATVFPMNMGVAAANDEVLTASAGWVTAREAWAMGIQIGFSPVVDVNTDMYNPIIATRSYSDRPELVARMAEAFTSGARRGGMLTCLKHYPGHGPTDQDSHLTIPIVKLSEDNLRQVHIYPYQQLIQNGFSDLVMTAHVWYEALDPGEDPWPATLSYRAMTEILRDDLGFTGLAISDAFSMAGVSGILEPGEAVVTAIKNGLDIILIPPDLAVSVAALQDAVQGGQLTESRIDASVRRILIAKSRCWLPEARTRDEAEMWNVLRHPEHLAIAETIARASITRVKEQPGVLPLQPEQSVLCLRLRYGSGIFHYGATSNFTDRLAAALPDFQLEHVDRSLDENEITAYLAAAEQVDRVVVAGYDWRPIITTSQINLVKRLIEGPTPVVYISFGSPYEGVFIPEMENYFLAYSAAEVSQWAGADVLLGVLDPQGTLPVSVYGHPEPMWQLY